MARVDFVGSPAIEALYRPALDALAGKGHDVRRFRDPSLYRDQGDVADLDVLVAFGTAKIDAGFMDRAPRLRALVSPVTGTEAFDENAASLHTIVVANGQVIENYVSMAESAIMLVLAALYELNNSQRILAENAPRPSHHRARMLYGKTVGLFGFGRIGQAIAARLAAWDCRIFATVRTPRPLPAHVEPVSLDRLLRDCDVVVVATELNSQTRGMLTEETLRTMKPDVTFVNVARGGIADDNVLAKLASERPEMHLALDVFDPEPLVRDSPLRQLTNAILTPHMVGHTRETHERLPLVVLENVEAALAGRAPAYVRNPEVIPRWQARCQQLETGPA